MKKLIARTVIALALSSLVGATAVAGAKRERIKLDEAVRVGETTIEAGSYEVKYDKVSGELSFMKGRKVVAKAKARAEQSSAKNRSTTFTIGSEGSGRVMRSIAFGGDKQVFVLGEAGGGAVTGGTR